MKFFFGFFLVFLIASVNCSINIDLSYRDSDEKITVSFFNIESEPIHLLNMHTPMDLNIESNMFDIVKISSDSGKNIVSKIDYVGPKYKRILSQPLTPDQSSLLLQGGFIGSQVKLEKLLENYNFNEAGTYLVTFSNTLFFSSHFHNNDGVQNKNQKLSLQELFNQEIFHQKQFTSENHILIQLTHEHIQYSKQYQQATFNINKQVVNRVASGIGYIGCDDAESKNIAEYVNPRAVCALQQVIPDTDSATTLYTTWFGDYQSSRASTVDSNLQKILKVASSGDWIGDCTLKGCGFGVYAYVYPTDKSHVVHLCSGYFSASNEIKMSDTQPGTVIHELAHFNDVAGTDDIQYGSSGCQRLAKTKPQDAIKNSDSYEYYNEDCGCGGIFGKCYNP